VWVNTLVQEAYECQSLTLFKHNIESVLYWSIIDMGKCIGNYYYIIIMLYYIHVVDNWLSIGITEVEICKWVYPLTL